MMLSLQEIPNHGKYYITGNYAKFCYSTEAEEFLKTTYLSKDSALFTESESILQTELTPTRFRVPSYGESPYYKKYYMYVAETLLFGDSSIDISTIDSETRFFYWKNYNGTSIDQKNQMEHHDIRKKLDASSYIEGLSKTNPQHMMRVFFDLIYYFPEIRKAGRTHKLVSIEEFNKDYRDKTTVTNLKWWHDGIEEISIRGRLLQK